MTIQLPRGSEWRRWDLHIHTPASYLNNNFGDDWDNYVQTLFRTVISKDIHAIALTDYFSIDGYTKVKEEYLDDSAKLQSLFTEDEIERIDSILVLPNIEFRLKTFVGSNSVNFHVLFSDDVPLNDITDHFLHDLKFVYQGDPQRADYKRRLKISELIEFGARLKRGAYRIQ